MNQQELALGTSATAGNNTLQWNKTKRAALVAACAKGLEENSAKKLGGGLIGQGSHRTGTQHLANGMNAALGADTAGNKKCSLLTVTVVNGVSGKIGMVLGNTAKNALVFVTSVQIRRTRSVNVGAMTFKKDAVVGIYKLTDLT
ncbi:hypothetical protein TRVL_08055 [Trypanosoma vivax]|nr:hypothetical protein TRVL_08055 [Trypanosoma vivax]